MAVISTLGQIGGIDVFKAQLSGADGLRLTLLSYGARVAELWVPDRNGVLADIVLGHDSAADWEAFGGYLGATCGRYANRIAGGTFMLDGHAVQVDQNEGVQHLHGGVDGFHSKHWLIDSHSDTHVTFTAVSAAGEMGYPAALQASVTYKINGARLEIEMVATSDAPTVVNLVNHAYFNLAGHKSGDVLAQNLRVHAGFYLPVDDRLIPTGEVLSVKGTAFDFQNLRPIGAAFPTDQGFDHNLCLSAPIGPNGLRPCLEAVDPASGRRLQLATTEPGVQLYTGAHFDGSSGKSGARYPKFAGFAIETQRFPDSPNTPHFPSARLEKGQTYRHLMQFDFTPLAE